MPRPRRARFLVATISSSKRWTSAGARRSTRRSNLQRTFWMNLSHCQRKSLMRRLNGERPKRLRRAQRQEPSDVADAPRQSTTTPKSHSEVLLRRTKCLNLSFNDYAMKLRRHKPNAPKASPPPSESPVHCAEMKRELYRWLQFKPPWMRQNQGAPAVTEAKRCFKGVISRSWKARGQQEDRH